MSKIVKWKVAFIKAISICASSEKRIRFWTFTDAFGSFRRFRRAVKADSHVSGIRIRPKRKWTICYWRLFFMIVFIRRAPVKHNTTSQCIRAVAATYGCKIFQLYEYNANVYGYDANCGWHPKKTSLCSIQDSWLPEWGISASVLTVHTILLYRNNNKSYCFFDDYTTERTSYSYRLTAECESAITC